MSDVDEKKREALIEGARKILAEKSWPVVTSVFLYPSTDKVGTPAEEVSALKTLLEARSMPNTIRLVEIIKMEEERLGVKVHGVSIILIARDLPPIGEQTLAQTMRAFTTPDIMIGTRPWQGNTVALEWLMQFATNAATYPAEPRQVFDNIIGDAVKMMETRGLKKILYSRNDQQGVWGFGKSYPNSSVATAPGFSRGFSFGHILTKLAFLA